jgi:tetrahydromethanopterin S-methyltransferase subunit C
MWASIAYVFFLGAFGPIIRGGLIASSLIGLLVGVLYRRTYKLPKVNQLFLSLVSLYLAVAVLGFAAGFYDA